MSKKHKRKPVSVGFVALGCPKNMVDSEAMLAQIGQDGFVLSGDPDAADVVVIRPKKKPWMRSAKRLSKKRTGLSVRLL
jgi:hypothetical protein